LYPRAGVPVAPGMTIRYVVRDARAGLADSAWVSGTPDRHYYRRMLTKAWGEVAAGLGCPGVEGAGMDPGKQRA